MFGLHLKWNLPGRFLAYCEKKKIRDHSTNGHSEKRQLTNSSGRSKAATGEMGTYERDFVRWTRTRSLV